MRVRNMLEVRLLHAKLTQYAATLQQTLRDVEASRDVIRRQSDEVRDLLVSHWHAFTTEKGPFGTYPEWKSAETGWRARLESGERVQFARYRPLTPAFFGPTAQFSCLTNSKNCKFKYDYHSKRDQALLFSHWQDRGHGAGTFLVETFKGDIADA